MIPTFFALDKYFWLRVQVQINQTPDSSAIKHCYETDNAADRQPRCISWAVHPDTTSCSTHPLQLINISSHLTQIRGSCCRRSLPCNYSVPGLVNTALNHPPQQLASGAPGWLQTSSERTACSSKSKTQPPTSIKKKKKNCAANLSCILGIVRTLAMLLFERYSQTGCGHIPYK